MSELQNYYNSITANLGSQCNGVRTCPDCGGDGVGHPTGQRIPCRECGPEDQRNCYRCSATGWVDEYATCKKCKGSGVVVTDNCGGWIFTDLDTVHKCPFHYNGQPHPEL